MANTPNFLLYKPNRADANVEVDTSLSDNFDKIDTELKTNKDGLATHISNPNAHTSENVSHADGSVKTTLDNHTAQLADLQLDTADVDARVTDIETLGLDKLAPNLEGRIQTIESDVEGFLAPATFDAMNQQSYTFDEYRIGYVDSRLAERATNTVYAENYKIQVPETDDTARINRAITAAGVSGRLIIAPITYNISGKITFNSHVFASGAIFNVTANLPIAVEVREGTGATLFRGKTVHLPDIIKQTKTWDGTDIGLQLTNVYESEIFLGKVNNFSYGVRLTAFGTGTSYNNIFVKQLDNNKVNMQLIPGDSSAWVNENNFYGGRFSHNSGEGTNVVGSRQILISNGGFACNNNSFYKPSLEGDVPEYHIECWGKFNYFYSGRYEATTPKVAFRSIDATNYAHSNVIFYGYNAQSIQVTEDANVKWNHIFNREQLKIHTTTSKASIVGINTYSSNNHTFAVLDATCGLTSDPATDYSAGVGANYSRYKRKADTYPRIEIDHQNAKINYGSGTSAVDVNSYRYGSIGLKTDYKMLAVNGIGVGNSMVATTLGTVTKKMEVFDANGVSLGFVPIYNSIT